MNEDESIEANVVKDELEDLSDVQIEWIFRHISRLDFDRIRRKINWLTHRRTG